jgi:hypothetical protein
MNTEYRTQETEDFVIYDTYGINFRLAIPIPNAQVA